VVHKIPEGGREGFIEYEYLRPRDQGAGGKDLSLMEEEAG